MVWLDLVYVREQGSGYLCNTYHYFLVFAISKLILGSTPSPIPLFHCPYLNNKTRPAYNEQTIPESFLSLDPYLHCPMVPRRSYD